MTYGKSLPIKTAETGSMATFRDADGTGVEQQDIIPPLRDGQMCVAKNKAFSGSQRRQIAGMQTMAMRETESTAI